MKWPNNVCAVGNLPAGVRYQSLTGMELGFRIIFKCSLKVVIGLRTLFFYYSFHYSYAIDYTARNHIPWFLLIIASGGVSAAPYWQVGNAAGGFYGA